MYEGDIFFYVHSSGMDLIFELNEPYNGTNIEA